MLSKTLCVPFLLLWLIALSAEAQSARAVSSPENSAQSRIALVIGNGAYADARLRNPPNDARVMSQALRECNFQVIEKVDANFQAMEQAIREFGRRLQRGGVGLFYFAGHGMQIQDSNYLIPVGADIKAEDEVKFKSVDAGRVLGKMESAGTRTNIVILDACRNNPFARSFRSSTRGLMMMDAPQGSILAYATEPGAVADDGDGEHGLYTSMLLRHMRKPGVRIEQIFKYVRLDVMERSDNAQTPWEHSSLVQDFYFVESGWEPEKSFPDPVHDEWPTGQEVMEPVNPPDIPLPGLVSGFLLNGGFGIYPAYKLYARQKNGNQNPTESGFYPVTWGIQTVLGVASVLILPSPAVLLFAVPGIVVGGIADLHQIYRKRSPHSR